MALLQRAEEGDEGVGIVRILDVEKKPSAREEDYAHGEPMAWKEAPNTIIPDIKECNLNRSHQLLCPHLTHRLVLNLFPNIFLQIASHA